MLIWTLPNPRMNYYESNDYAVIKAGVLDYVTNIVEDIGLYPVTN